MSRWSPERWSALSARLDRALELAPEERDAWLDSMGEEDAALARDLRALLEEGDLLDREGFLDHGPPLPGPAIRAGQEFGPYTLVSLIGRGGMGSVWLARRSDGRFAGQAAVKVLDAALAGHATEERFRREGDFLARLAHPHIAHLFDAGVSPEGRPYLVLEHVDGQQLDRYCDRQGLGVAERIRLFLQVLEAVAHAHAHMIVHRDIKPSNVLVGRDGRVKLLDFGIAKLLDTDEGGGTSSLTHELGRALTPEYAAPEQVHGGAVTTATDVYSLGVLLYELLGGCRPPGAFPRTPQDLLPSQDGQSPRLSDAVRARREQASATLADAATLRSTTPRRLHRQLKGDLDAILAKALKKAPEERYASATAFADDLRRFLHHEPVGARPATLAYRAVRFVGRNRKGAVAAAAAVVALAGLLAFHATRLAAERDRARRAADRAGQVSRLLTSLLTEASRYGAPGLGAGQAATVGDVLDAGAERVRRELAPQPELQAEMLTVIGGAYQRLAANDKARPLLEEGLALGRQVHGPEHEQVAQALNDLGVLLRDTGDPEGALPLLEQALALRRKLLGPDHRDVAVTLVELARLHANQKRREHAQTLLREALAIGRAAPGDGQPDAIIDLNDLALLR